MNDMNGNVNSADIATLSLLGRPYGYGGGYGGGGGGPWGAGGSGGGYGYGGHSGVGYLAAESGANGTAVNAKIEGNGHRIDAQTQMFDSAERSRQFTELKDSQSEERLSTQAAVFQLQKDIADNAKEAAKCCCDTNLEATKSAAALTAEIKAVESRTISRELDRCERRLESSDSTSAVVAAMREQTSQLVSILAANRAA